jgi:hypothetical protein
MMAVKAPQPSPAQYLSHVCAVLKNAAPNEWQQFVEAFGILADDVTVKVVEADAAVVLIAQGSARQMNGLLKTFLTCKPYVPAAPTAGMGTVPGGPGLSPGG